MIFGLTHEADTGSPNQVTQYYGKISTGYASGEGPNTGKGPMACSFYRILVKKQIRVPQSGGKNILIEKWVENQEVHSKVGKEPTELSFVCMGKTPAEIWTSRLTYWGNSRVKCTGDGKKAVFYKDMGDNTTQAQDVPCPYEECPYYKQDLCHAEGRLKVYLKDDFHLMAPYRLDTKSYNSIMSIESSLTRIYGMLQSIHMVSGKSMADFTGLSGLTLRLVLRPKKSGANMVYITSIEMPKETEQLVNTALLKVMGKQQLTIGLEVKDVIPDDDEHLFIQNDPGAELVSQAEQITEALGVGPVTLNTESLPDGKGVIMPTGNAPTYLVAGEAQVDSAKDEIKSPEAPVKTETVQVAASDVLSKMQAGAKKSPITFTEGD